MNRKQTISRTKKDASNKPSKIIKPSPLHPRNIHIGRYDFDALVQSNKTLAQFIIPSPSGDQTINFKDANAVLNLNKALLAHYYHVEHWDIPKGYLCPPIPGRADYIHYLADLLAETTRQTLPTDKKVPTGKQVKVLDIGTGANCIYPIIGSQSYGWQFVGADIDPTSVKTANLIAMSNPCLASNINVHLQKNSNQFFKGIIQDNDRFSLTLCNPPFHSSMKEAQSSNQRKWRNLNKGKPSRDKSESKLNFGGQKAELWCPGGEIAFLKGMAKESAHFANQVCWFTTLISKGDNVGPLKHWLKTLGVKQTKVVNMSQGQKVSRFIAWSFLTKEEQYHWTKKHWE